MNYYQLFSAIQDYTENQFQTTYLNDGTTVSPTQQINRFIEQAELRIYNQVQLPSLRKNVTGTVTPNNPYLSCPNDYLSTYSMAAFTYASTTASGTALSYALTVTSSTNINVGQTVVGPNIVTGSKVTAVVGNLVTISIPLSGSFANEAVVFQGDYVYLLNKDVNFIREAYPNPAYVGLPYCYGLFGSQYSYPNELSFILGPTPNQNYQIELHYYYYPVSIIQNVISGLATSPISNPGYGLTNGVYTNVPATGGSGDGALLNVTVSGGIVTAVTISYGGSGYLVGDTLSAQIGTTGSPFSVIISAVNNPTGTSWLGDNFDTALLYACLVEAYTYMKGDTDMMALYNDKYVEAMAELKRLGDGLERQDAYRSGQVRIPVT